jgi:hypothetical protein
MHDLTHLAVGEAVRGLVVDCRGVDFFGAGLQVLDEGNTENLLDDVGNFPENRTTHDDGRHGARGNAPVQARSNHDRGLSAAHYLTFSPISTSLRNAAERVMLFAAAQASTSAIRAGGIRAAICPDPVNVPETL